MEYTIENEWLAVTVNSHGAEAVSAVNKADGAQMIWNADPKVWNRHAPILFPYVGRLKNGSYRLDGKTYTGGGHGFARDSEFEVMQTAEDSITLRLMWNESTLALFPRKFCLTVSYRLEGKTLRQLTEVTNLDNREMRFGLGYHPGFCFPFDDRHTTEDYELRFSSDQEPEEVLFDRCFMTADSRPYMKKGPAISLSDRMFDNDSIFFRNLDAKTVSLLEKDTGRAITMELTGFPYFVIWSSLGQEHLKFFCLEPWHAHPDTTDSDGDWNKKACTAALVPNETWTSHLNVTFDR